MSRVVLLIPLIAGFLLSGCVDEFAPAVVDFERPETAVDYDVELSGVERASIDSLMKQALELYRQQDKGAQSLAFLRRRAEGDVATVLKIMRSDGFFEAEAEIEVIAPEDRPAAAPGEKPAETPARKKDGPSTATAEKTDAAAEGRALVRVMVEPRRRYTLAAHRFLMIETGAGAAPLLPDAGLLGSPVGDSARADRILAAEGAAVARLHAEGRPYAKFIGRDAVADPSRAELEVETTIAAGGAYVFGPVSYTGVESIDPAYLDTYIPFEEGAAANPEKLSEFQQDLIATGLFNAGSARFPETPPEGGVAPVEVTLEEAKPRTVSAGALYSSDAGPAVTGGFEHRNLYGANETLSLDALIGLDEQSLDTRYRIPQWGRPGQDLVFGFNPRHVNDAAFEEYGATIAAGLEREISRRLTVGAGGLVEYSRVDDGSGFINSTLVGLPVFAAFDTTDDWLDPSKGIRARVAATPYAGLVDGSPASFAVLDSSASTYFDLTGQKRYILAARARLGSVISGDFDIVSANKRLYSGGGGSVRGYRERFIGPLDADGDPTGGLSVVELGLEMRARVSDTIGLAAFVESGAVSTETFPAFDESVQVAAGGGVRYFSPIGPLRFDIGVPVNPRKVDDFFQFYISIGQAF
ncbi:autotransporter assembly complex family protein [Pikeienuella sp. HZG-20]|uniref:autotransporter assembly complex protein TamA n=1 Tax=Paludibacillus litoralis TaxID=3133267 RepID=UPI0030EEC889